MFNFDLKRTKIWQALKLERFLKFAKPLKILFFAFFVLTILLFFWGLYFETFSIFLLRKLFGFSLIFFVFCFFAFLKEKFFELKLKKPLPETKLSEVFERPEEYNLAEFVSFEVAKATKKSLVFSGVFSVSSSHLFYFLLVDNPDLRFVFSRLLLNFKEIKKILKKEIKTLSEKDYSSKWTRDFEFSVLEALAVAKEKGHRTIEVGDVISGLSRYNPIFKSLLFQNDLKPEDVDNVVIWYEGIKKEIQERKRFWEKRNLAKKGGVARTWTAGFTPTLDRFSVDLTEIIKRKNLEFVGHQREKEAIERILAGGELNNVLIVGESGTGKMSIVYHLAKRSLLGQCLKELNYKRFVRLDINLLISQIDDPEELEKTFDKIFQEAVRAGNVIVVIDQIHQYVAQIPRPGIVDISGVLQPYLRLPQFKIIGITTYEGLHRYIEQNSSFLSFFEKVEVSPISRRETILLLEKIIPFLEKKYKVFISYPIISQIVFLADRYFPYSSFPEKAIGLLKEVVVYSASIKKKIITKKEISKIVTEKTEIPIGEINPREREILLNLENLIHQRIVNQQKAVKELATALRRARSEIAIRKGPIGTFLFLGPTGVGKTETAKALAQYYFGSEDKIIRLDMSEFQEIKDISRLIGTSKEPGLLTTPVRENPFSLVLLDEIEKAHFNVLNLFLQVLDEGHITDGTGRKVDFKNTIIIATSNAGYKIILEAIRKNLEWSKVKEKLLNYLFEKRIFRPEFINRFDAVVVFRPLCKADLLKIAGLMLGKLKNNLKEKGIEFVITEQLKEKIVELGYNPIFGAREMRRVIQDKIGNVLAFALLSGKLKKGDRIKVDPEKFDLIVD